MGYQFAHIETYSRSGGRGGGHTVRDIIAEALRAPEACLHVPNPRPPILVVGCDLEELERRHDDVVLAARETLTNGRQRAVRKDTASLFTCVLSHPATPEECRRDPAIQAAVTAWAKDSARWLRQDLAARGGVLETVVMHVDESHVHLHAYGLHPSGHADRLHPGKIAKKAAVDTARDAGHDKKAANAIGDKAYVEAMRAWQDSYSQDVALAHGLTRLGPARRRLSRAEWKAEQAAARSVQKAKADAEAAARAARTSQELRDRILEQAEEAAARTQAAAEASAVRLRAEAQAQREAAHALVRRQRQSLASHEGWRRRIRSLGILLRMAWDSLFISLMRQRLEAASRKVLEGERARSMALHQKLDQERARRQAVERRLSDAVAAAHEVGRQRDRARRQMERLRGPVPEPRSAPVPRC